MNATHTTEATCPTCAAPLSQDSGGWLWCLNEDCADPAFLWRCDGCESLVAASEWVAERERCRECAFASEYERQAYWDGRIDSAKEDA